MTFYSLDKEERSDWRELVPTKLAIAMLREKQAEAEQEALTYARNGDNRATASANKADGLALAISLMERDE